MADGIDIKGAVPTVMIAAALGAGAALFTDRGTKKAVTFGLVGAGVGAFAHLVLGVSLTGRSGGHAVGQGLAERLRTLPSHTQSLPPSRFATWPAKLGRTLSGGAYEVGQGLAERGRLRPGAMRGLVTVERGGRAGGFRARGDFGVGFDGDDDFFDDDYDACPYGYYTDLWGNCIPVVFSIEREILYLYPEIVIQFPELRLHPDRLFRFRPELRQRYAGVRSAHEMRARYQQVHRQPPPARPKDAPPASKSVAPTQGAPHGKHGGQPAAPSAAPPAHGPGGGTPHPVMPPPSAPPPQQPPAHAALTPPSLPSSPTSKQAPPQTPQVAQHAATGWYTPGWQHHFPPIAYEYSHYGPMEYWWVQPDSRFALY